MKVVLDASAINRAITRLSYEIIEKNKGTSEIVLVGVKTRGIPLAKRIQKRIFEIEGTEVPCGQIDVTFYRDDLVKRSAQPIVHQLQTSLVQDKTVIIVDDVVFTGRTCRATIDALIEEGRPAKVQFVSLIDRGHRELPIRPDYVGKNLPTSKKEVVHVHLAEIDGQDEVVIDMIESPSTDSKSNHK